MIFSTLIFANVREFSFQPGRSKPRKNSNICYTLTANSINSFSASKSGKPVLVFGGGGGCGWVTLKIFNRIKKNPGRIRSKRSGSTSLFLTTDIRYLKAGIFMIIGILLFHLQTQIECTNFIMSQSSIIYLNFCWFVF